MFDSTLRKSQTSRERLATSLISASMHGAILAALAIPALYAADALPEPPTIMAFVGTPVLPSPPPPPPAPPRETPPRAEPARSVRATVTPQHQTRPVAAAPTEAPSGITPETGREGMPGAQAPAIEAGFEAGVTGGVVGGIVGSFQVAAPAPPPRAPMTPVRVGGDITAPRLVQRVNPEYPLIAQGAQITGVVILEAIVNTEGLVIGVRVLRPHFILQDAAMDAVRQWRYEPLMLNGQAQPFVLTVTVSFSLADH